MNCKNCNAVMKADVERKLFVCPYCESTEPFDSVSKKELEGMLHDAIRDVRKESIKEAKKQLEKQQAEKRTPAQKAFDTFVWVLQVIVCVILSIFSVAIFTEYVGLGVISLLQLILMIVGMVMKSKYNKTHEEKYKKIKTGCFIGAAVLVIVWFICLMNDGESVRVGGEKKTWPTQGLGATLPEPNAKLKYSPNSSNTSFSASLSGLSKEDFDAYVEECKEAGYNVDVEVGEESFTAYHEETDDCLTIRYYKSSNDAYIDIDKAIVLDEEWPSKNAIAKQIPTPEVTTCYVKTISDTRIEVYVGDVTNAQLKDYIATCQEAGFKGSYYSENKRFYGSKDDLTINVTFIRGRIMVIEVYQYPN